MNQRSDEMTEAELASWQYAHRDELDAEAGELVEVDVSPQVSVTMSFRLSGDEADVIRRAAADAGMSLSEWIRQVCAEAASGGTAPSPHLGELLEEAQRQLARAQKELIRTRKKGRAVQKVRGGSRAKRTGVAAAKRSGGKKKS